MGLLPFEACLQWPFEERLTKCDINKLDCYQCSLFESPNMQLAWINWPCALPDTDEALNSPCLLSQQARGELMSSLSSPE